MKCTGLVLVLLLFCSVTVFGQSRRELTPTVHFSKEVVQIGEPVRLSLVIRYPSDRQLLFPDTSDSFSPFELRKKEFFPTRTIGELSRDCVVYELATFGLDTVQTVQLPVYEFSETDSIRWLSNTASVRIKPVFEGPLPANPVFQTELTPVSVAHQINYPYILGGLGLVILVILLVNIFFDRPIQKFIYLYIEQRRHTAFLKTYERFRAQLEMQLTIENMENMLNLWKKYIQKVDGNPYTSLTSMEIYKILPDAVLKDVLQQVDRWIYGGVEMQDVRFNMDYVKQIAIQLYQKKRDAIRNGKFE